MEQPSTANYGGEPNPVDSTGLCLLSLDGGGVRGLSSLYILKSIMDRLNGIRAQSKLPRVKPCEMFDLIGGTSTGGLIAIMLGRLEMDVDECIDAYSDLAASVFGDGRSLIPRRSLIPFDIKGDVKARFDSAKLESAIRKVVKDRDASEQDLFNDGRERGCRTFVCTADRYTKDIVRLRSYGLPYELDISATICQAALATSAATAFFEPVSIEDRSFADGGLGANNPVDEVEGEAANIWCPETGDLKPLVKCFISIGTGNPGKKPFENSMLKLLGKTVVQIATETENTEKKFIARWAKHFDEKRYFRFNVEQGLQKIGLAEYKEKGAMKAATDSYLTHTAQKFRVRDCIQNLKLKQNKPETSLATVIHEYTIRANRGQPVADHTLWIVPFERNSRFTGREPQLAQLEGMLLAPDRTAKIAVMGLGGVGKTHLVLELLFRTKHKYPDCTVIWIPTTNKESLHQEYLDAAQQLKIPGWDDNEEDVKQLVQGYLSRESTGQWLLVFDNADDIDLWIDKTISRPQPEQGSRPLIDYLPRSKQGTILFTTRDKRVAIKLAQQNVVEVPAMGEKVAAQLLENCLIDPKLVDSQQDTNALLSQLTYLPLAIVQATAFINENGIAIADYLSLLGNQEEEVIDLLSEEFEDEGRYRDMKNPVATTWLISFEQIRRHNPLTAEYLSFIAYMEPKDIPQSILPPGPTRKKEIDAIGSLNAYSFVTRRPADMVLDLHRLVHLSTRNWLHKEEQLEESMKKAIRRLDEVFPNARRKNRSLWRTYLTHVRYALESDLVEKDWKARMNLMGRYTMCLYHDGRWDDAETSIIQVLDIRRTKLGAEHPDTLSSMANLASTYIHQGRLKAAEELCVQVIETYKKKLGAEDPDTLTSMNNLASIYIHQGRLEAAEELHLQVMETRKRKLGAEHPDTLNSTGNLASTYMNQGRLEAAEELHMQVIETCKKKLRAEYPDTLTSMGNLAFTWKIQGRSVQAICLMSECVQRQRHVLGSNHPDFISSSKWLAAWRAEEAENNFSSSRVTDKRC